MIGDIAVLGLLVPPLSAHRIDHLVYVIREEMSVQKEDRVLDDEDGGDIESSQK